MSRPADPLAKSKLLCAARQEFASVGLAAARVEDIAKRAQVAKGTFYLHFKSKETAFNEIVDHFLAELQRTTDEYYPTCAAQTDPATALDELQQHDEQLLAFLWNHREILQMIYSSRGRHRYASTFDAFLDAQAAGIARTVRQLQHAGVYADDFDPDACAWLVAGAWFNLTRRMGQMSTKPDLKLWAWTLRRLFGQGLVPR